MKLNYDKYADGLVPAIVQDADTRAVLMLGFLDADAIQKTLESGLVTFYSRSRQRMWTKGETSGNYLKLISIDADCDNDSVLISARPTGPICHTGTATCFVDSNTNDPIIWILTELENVIDKRRMEKPESSYVASLFQKGINKIAQKVGEEAVELVIEAKDDDLMSFKSEAADLLFHYLVLLRAKNVPLKDILKELSSRRCSEDAEH